MRFWRLLIIFVIPTAFPLMAMAAEEGGKNPLQSHFTADTAIWTAVVFLVLLGVLWKFAWGPITQGLDKRERGIADDIEQARRQNEEAKVLLGQYDEKLIQAQGEVREIIEEARRDAEYTQQEILARAREEAQRERDRAIRDIDLAAQQALDELARKSVDLAIDLAGKLVTAQLSPEDHARMVQEAVSRIVQSEPSRN